MTAPIIGVCGLARCGTSLLMQMLAKAGVPTLGTLWPGYEHPMVTQLPDVTSWLDDAHGHAIKFLDPHKFTPPSGLNYRFIWLDRNVSQQAKSQLKLFSALFPNVPISRQDRRSFAKSYVVDRPKAIGILTALAGRPPLVLQFEDLLQHPSAEAARVAAFLESELDIDAMVGEVRPRSTNCLPYLMEAEMLEELGGA